jgi:hypothetical protein
MGQVGAACDRCGRPLAAHEAWTLVQGESRSTLCEACALDVGPALASWSPGSELVPPPEPPPAEAEVPQSALAAPDDEDDDEGAWSRGHPIAWFLGSLVLLVLAFAPFVFFYWLASR